MVPEMDTNPGERIQRQIISPDTCWCIKILIDLNLKIFNFAG